MPAADPLTFAAFDPACALAGRARGVLNMAEAAEQRREPAEATA